MANEKQGEQHGPVHTGSTEFFGHEGAFKATDGGIYNGVPGYPKGSPTKAPELAFDESGSFGKVPAAKPKE